MTTVNAGTLQAGSQAEPGNSDLTVTSTLNVGGFSNTVVLWLAVGP